MADVKQIPFGSIIVDEEFVKNSREKWNTGLKELAANIYTQGLLMPLTVTKRDEKYVVVAGFRRYAAIASMEKFDDFDTKFGKVPCTIVEGEKKKLQQYNLVENLQREDLTPAEQANGFSSLRELGMTQKQIGEAVGKSQAYVSILLKLVENLADPAWDAFCKGELGVNEAKEMASFDKDEQLKRMGLWTEAMEAAVDDDSVDEGEAKKGKISKAKKEAKKKIRDAVLPGQRAKWAVTVKKAMALYKGAKEYGINPRHTDDSYVDGVCDVLAYLLGETEKLPFDTLMPEKPKAKRGRPKKDSSADANEETVEDEDISDLVFAEEEDEDE